MQSYDVLIYEKIPGKSPREKYENLDTLLACKITSWRMEMNWTWGRNCRFMETSFHSFVQNNKPDIEQIKVVTRVIFEKICKNYTYDCGNKEHPLNPLVTYIQLTPQSNSVNVDFQDFGFSEILESFK